MNFKPLLAHTISDTAALNYPVLASVKLDGIRCVVIDGVAYSRNLKPIRNKYIQNCIGRPEYNGLDGELVVGSIFAKDCYRVTSSGVMSEDGEPDFTFWVFDRFDMDRPYEERDNAIHECSLLYACPVDQIVVDCEEELLYYESRMLERGAEGVHARHPRDCSALRLDPHLRSRLRLPGSR